MRFWNSEPLDDLDEAAEVARRFCELHRERGFAPWRVGERGGALVGSVGLQPLGQGEVEIIFALLPSRWGRGLATEAGRAVLSHGFADAALPRIVGIAKPENHASLRVMQRLGMRLVGEAEYFGRSWIKYVADADQRSDHAG
jgi:[ribosomal protein S5]-alanine N-acetyltransferase